MHEHGIVRIGSGNIAKLHHNCTEDYVQVLAAIDTDMAKSTFYGPTVKKFNSLDKFFISNISSDQIFYYDICTPTNTHLELIEKVLVFDPAANILIEKPVCLPDQLQELEALVSKYPDAKISINEQYNSSVLLSKIKKEMVKLGIAKNALEIYLESIKDRRTDFRNGR